MHHQLTFEEQIASLNKKSPKRKTRNDLKDKDKIHWNKYIADSKKNKRGIILDGKKYFSKSYTQLFFNAFNLTEFEDPRSAQWLQLGASRGDFLATLKKPDENKLIGYDYAPKSIQVLGRKKILARNVDFNIMDSTGSKLAYENQLIQDLAAPSNIIAVRFLSYLNTQALCLLVHLLIQESKPGSVFYFVNPIHENKKNFLPCNYIASFFSARTDIEFLFVARTDNKEIRKKLSEFMEKNSKSTTPEETDNDEENYDEINVFKKHTNL